MHTGTGTMLVTSVGLFSEEGIVQKLITGVGQEEVSSDLIGWSAMSNT